MNIATLFGKLREHELELGRLKEEEDGEKRHNIALKSVVKIVARVYPLDDNSANYALMWPLYLKLNQRQWLMC